MHTDQEKFVSGVTGIRDVRSKHMSVRTLQPAYQVPGMYAGLVRVGNDVRRDRGSITFYTQERGRGGRSISGTKI